VIPDELPVHYTYRALVHSVSLSLTNLSKFYGVSKTDISTSITLTLLFRSLGAAVFGVAGDYYGRKWPMVINM
jgi:SHS family lactate transporter-like MFS transporter